MNNKVKISDFFCKYGFCGGDYLDLNAYVFSIRPIVIEWFYEYFAENDLSYEVKPVDAHGTKNPCRLRIEWSDEEYVYQWSETYGVEKRRRKDLVWLGRARDVKVPQQALDAIVFVQEKYELSLY